MKKMNKKGFTLAELLIVVAIIAVLVAIAIPIFGAQLEKSREATDLANLRSKYAELVAARLTDDTAASTGNVPVNQRKADWDTTNAKVANFEINNTNVPVAAASAASGKNYTITINDTGAITGITIS